MYGTIFWEHYGTDELGRDKSSRWKKLPILICKEVKRTLQQKEKETLIAPPYYYGDLIHIESILHAIKRANSELDMKIRFVMDAMDLEVYGLNGNEDFLYVFAPQYKMEWFEGGNSTVEVVPFGYAGNPKGYEAVSSIAKELLQIQVNAICENM